MVQEASVLAHGGDALLEQNNGRGWILAILGSGEHGGMGW